MLTTIEAEVDVNGNVRLLEPLSLKRPSRAIVTILEEGNGNGEGNGQNVLEFLMKNRLPEESRPKVEEIDAQITEARNSWD